MKNMTLKQLIKEVVGKSYPNFKSVSVSEEFSGGWKTPEITDLEEYLEYQLTIGSAINFSLCVVDQFDRTRTSCDFGINEFFPNFSNMRQSEIDKGFGHYLTAKNITKPTFKLLNGSIEMFGVEVINFDDTFCYMFTDSSEAINALNDWLLETFPSYYGMISQGQTYELESIPKGVTNRNLYISIAIY